MAATAKVGTFSRRTVLKVSAAAGAGFATFGPLLIGLNAQGQPTVKLVMSAAPVHAAPKSPVVPLPAKFCWKDSPAPLGTPRLKLASEANV